MRENTSTRKWIVSVVLLLVAALSMTSFVDQRAEVEYEKLFQRALITFALARTINGVISVVQGTEIALQPAGVGVTLTPGEILDPVNDLIERFSWIMMGATVSLGIQNVMLDISAWWLIQSLIVVLCAWVILRLWLPGKASAREGWQLSKLLLKRVLLVLLFVRFAVPVMLIVNDFLYQQFLESRYEASSQIITEAGDELKQLSVEAEAEGSEAGESGIMDSISQAWSNTFNSLDMSGKLDRMQTRASEVVEHLVQLSVVFILQTGLLPIAFLWVFLQIFKRLFRPIRLEKSQD
jgi:hypothetical protein